MMVVVMMVMMMMVKTMVMMVIFLLSGHKPSWVSLLPLLTLCFYALVVPSVQHLFCLQN